MENHLVRVSPSHFQQNSLIQTSNVCFKNFQISCLVHCHFLEFWKIQNTLKDVFSIIFIAITKRGGICILKVAYIAYDDRHSL